MNIIKIIGSGLKWLFNQPLFRHIFAIGVFYYFFVMPQIKDLRQLNEKQQQTISELAQLPKYSIKNDVNAGKKDNTVNLIPDNDLNVINPEPEKENKESFFKRLFKKK